MTSSCHNTRKRARQFERNPLDEDYGNEVPPMTAKQPMNQELLQWKNKAEMLQARVEELEAERAFLRQQIETLISQKKDVPVSEFLEDKEEQWPISMSSDSSTSEEDSSEEEQKKKKKKKKKKKSKKAKRLKFRDDDRGKRASTVGDVVSRYQRLLKITKKGCTMTKAFQKEGISRNAVADTAPIAELYLADCSTLESIQFDRGTTLAQLAQSCAQKITGDLGEKVLKMKRNGDLLPFGMKA